MILKELCHSRLLHFVYTANYASSFASELETFLVNNKITALCQTNMSPQYYIKMLQTMNMKLEKLLETPSCLN